MNNWTNGEVVKAESLPGERIGGWLYLVAIGMILSPIMNALHVKQLVEAAKNANWSIIWAQGPVTVLSVLFEFGIQGYMLIFSIILAGLFFSRAKSLPKMFVIYVVSIFLLGVVGAVITAFVPNITPQLVGEAIAFPISVFILGLIWIPYFLKSKRVKRTFVVQEGPNNRFERDAAH